MTIEKMKMWLDAMENELAVDFMDAVAVGEAAEKLCDAIASLRQAIAAAEKENALQALHNENERLGLYKDAYAEQEPVAWMYVNIDGECEDIGYGKTYLAGLDGCTPLYTHPPQRTEQETVIDKSAAIRIATALGWEPKREWVGLTDEEYFSLQMKIRTPMISVQDYINAMQMVEKALKEKNT